MAGERREIVGTAGNRRKGPCHSEQRQRILGLAGAVLVGAMCLACGVPPVSEMEDGGTRPPEVLTAAGHVNQQAPTYIRPVLVDARAHFPWNGYRSGSALVPREAPVRDHPLRPRFSWDRALAATHYELQIDDSCERSTYRSCELPSPEAVLVTTETDVNLEEPLPVSEGTPVGRRYYWRVRACEDEVCTAWTAVRYLDVGRAPEDYDGDGYSDVSVFFPRVAPEYEGYPGFRRVQIWRGGPEGPDPARVIALEQDDRDLRPHYVGPVGDINGDGFDDLFVLADRIEADGTLTHQAGALWPGGPEGPGTPTPIPWPGPPGWDWIPPESEMWVRAAGDFDGDGFDDAHMMWGGQVLYGSPRGLEAPEPPIGVSWLEIPRVELLDFNGDGYIDLAGVQSLRDEGIVLQWRAGAHALRGPAPLITTRSPSDAFVPDGELWRLGDMDRDGFPELAFARGVDVHVLWGERTFPSSYHGELFDRLPDIILSRLYGGDVDGDGYADMAVLRLGSPESSVTVLRGNAERGAVLGSDCRMRDPLAREVAVSPLHDYDADGYADQLWFARVNEDEPDDWRVLVFRGGPRGLPWAPTREVHGFLPARYMTIYVGGGSYEPW